MLYYILARKLRRVYNFGWENNSIVFMVAFYGIQLVVLLRGSEIAFVIYYSPKT
jgi:hypothetical protein